MTYQASTAYACVAFRIMENEGSELTEEYLEILMGVLYDFYTADEIQKIYTRCDCGHCPGCGAAKKPGGEERT